MGGAVIFVRPVCFVRIITNTSYTEGRMRMASPPMASWLLQASSSGGRRVRDGDLGDLGPERRADGGRRPRRRRPDRHVRRQFTLSDKAQRRLPRQI